MCSSLRTPDSGLRAQEATAWAHTRGVALGQLVLGWSIFSATNAIFSVKNGIFSEQMALFGEKMAFSAKNGTFQCKNGIFCEEMAISVKIAFFWGKISLRREFFFSMPETKTPILGSCSSYFFSSRFFGLLVFFSGKILEILIFLPFFAKNVCKKNFLFFFGQKFFSPCFFQRHLGRIPYFFGFGHGKKKLPP